MALQNEVIAFLIQNPLYLVQISHFTSTKAAPDHHITSTMLDRVRHSSSIFSLVLRLTNVLLCDPNTSNLDLSGNTFLFFLFPPPPSPNLPLSNVCWPVSDMAFYLPLCLGQHLGVASSLWMLGLPFLRVPFDEAASRGPVRRLFLKLETLMYLSSCLVVLRGLPIYCTYMET